MKLKSNIEEILRGKFSDTIREIEGVYQEASGDVEIGTKYTAKAVKARIRDIRDSFYKELELLAKDITETE